MEMTIKLSENKIEAYKAYFRERKKGVVLHAQARTEIDAAMEEHARRVAQQEIQPIIQRLRREILDELLIEKSGAKPARRGSPRTKTDKPRKSSKVSVSAESGRRSRKQSTSTKGSRSSKRTGR